MLLNRYEAIRAKESKYSFRRFAKDIGISPSNLSDIFKGRCGLSAEGALKIADALSMSKDDKLYFIDLVECKHARSKAEREAAQRRLQKRKNTPFKKIADENEMTLIDRWYYPAALDVIEVAKGQITSAELAKALSLSLEEATEAIETLIRLKFLKKEGGTYIRENNEIGVTSEVPSPSIRSYHRQFLNVAGRALENQPMKTRQFSSTVMTFDSKKIEEAQAFLIAMKHEFFRRFEAKTGTCDSVYAFNFQLFRLDQEKP